MIGLDTWLIPTPSVRGEREKEREKTTQQPKLTLPWKNCCRLEKNMKRIKGKQKVGIEMDDDDSSVRLVGYITSHHIKTHHTTSHHIPSGLIRPPQSNQDSRIYLTFCYAVRLSLLVELYQIRLLTASIEYKTKWGNMNSFPPPKSKWSYLVDLVFLSNAKPSLFFEHVMPVQMHDDRSTESNRID